MNRAFWNKKEVLVTGHTGFKGGWLSFYLAELGANVHGFALPPTSQRSFFETTNLGSRMATSSLGDIRDSESFLTALRHCGAEIVFHLAAQPLVRESYQIPQETFSVNVMGTISMLEACRTSSTVKAVVNITTDKCYENKEWFWAYREQDQLGGHDPYSASKACAELVSSAYRTSFLKQAGIHLATARAGNVIGGGDWAADRLIPDFLRAVESGEPLTIRSPNAVRPWQHVLEPVSGYLSLAQSLFEEGEQFAEAWNFGPSEDDAKRVAWLIEQLCNYYPEAQWNIEPCEHLHEASLLRLDSNKAKYKLGWIPRWELQTALKHTADWHKKWLNGEDMAVATANQIQGYLAA